MAFAHWRGFNFFDLVSSDADSGEVRQALNVSVTPTFILIVRKCCANVFDFSGLIVGFPERADMLLLWSRIDTFGRHIRTSSGPRTQSQVEVFQAIRLICRANSTGQTHELTGSSR